MKFYDKYKVRIVYKSGYYHDFWTWILEAQRGLEGLDSVKWAACSDKNKPCFINHKQIECIYQIGHKKCFRFYEPF